MRVMIQTVGKRIEKELDFEGKVSELIEKLDPGMRETLLSEKGRRLYTILVDGLRARPDSQVGRTVSILPVISGG